MAPRVEPLELAPLIDEAGRQGRDTSAVDLTKKKSAVKRMLSRGRKKKKRPGKGTPPKKSSSRESDTLEGGSLTDSAKAQRMIGLEFFGVDDEEARRILGAREEDPAPPPSREWESAGAEDNNGEEGRPDGDGVGGGEGCSYTPQQLRDAADLVKRNVEIQPRTHKLRTYPDCFVGSEAVDCLVESGAAANREDAAALGRAVAFELGAFVHVRGEREFLDGYYFYHIVEPAEAYRRLSCSALRMDKYGFLLDDDTIASSVAGASTAPSSFRGDAQWDSILDRARGRERVATIQSDVKLRARSGLPDSLRKRAWTVLTGVDLLMKDRPGEYAELVDRAEEELVRLRDDGGADQDCESGRKVAGVLKMVERDVHRTFPRHYLFHMDRPDAAGAAAEGVKEKDEEYTVEPYPPGRMAVTATEDYLRDSIASINKDNGEYDTDEDDDEDFSASTFSVGATADLDVSEKRRQFTRSVDETRQSFLHVTEWEHSVATVPVSNDGAGVGCPIPRKGTEDSETTEDGTVRRSSGRSLDILGDEEGCGSSPSHQLEDYELTPDAPSLALPSELLGMGHGHAVLRRVLSAYAMYDTEVGYCQGMNFIAAMFLTFLSEEESFWLLIVVMNEEPYKLRELFGEDMAGTHEVLYIAEKLIAQFLPKLSRHLEGEGIHVSMFVTQWLLTGYTSTFPFELVKRVWDSFLVEGWKVVYRVMLALLEAAQADVLERGFEGILCFLREYPSTVDGAEIMAGSLRIKLKRKHIQKHVTDWRKSSRVKDGMGGHRRDSDHASSMSSGTRNNVLEYLVSSQGLGWGNLMRDQ